MAQKKKEEVRSAILEAAEYLFRESGYHQTTIATIARRAQISPANIYVYFLSKFEILFALYDPWLRRRLLQLEEEVLAISEPRARLRKIFLTIWRDIPAEEAGYANNLMQALSTASSDDRYSRDLLNWAEAKITDLVAPCLPVHVRKANSDNSLAHLLFMAFDGFTMNYKLQGISDRSEAVAELVVTLILDSQRVHIDKRENTER